MLLSVVAVLGISLQVKAGAQVRTDTTARQASREISLRPERGEESRRIPVTDEHRRTAFRDTAARTLLERARIARMRQDSAIVSYDAMTYQRISAGLGIARFGRDRLIFRTENASRVRWHRDRGALVDVKGARTVLPGIPKEGQDDAERDIAGEGGDMAPVPYYPGHETLWIGTGIAKADVNERELVHPLANGAEAYYVYESGDAAGFRLPTGRDIRLRELKVRPRRTAWNVVVGSLWFDVESGQLVRAAYRLAEPMDIWAKVREEDEDAEEDVPGWVKPMITPMRAQVTAIAVEYGLHQGRIWLPRVQAAEGSAQASFMRVPFKMEQSFRYASVNAPEIRDSMPAEFPVPKWERDRAIRDSLPEDRRKAWDDSVDEAGREHAKARADSAKRGLKRVAVCDTAAFLTTYHSRGDGALRTIARVPCDAKALATSPELPKSIYDEGDELFDGSVRDALIAEALSMGAQPPFGVQPPEFAYGWNLARFNRVEGLSLAATATQTLGAGYTADALLRLGVADLEPNVELGLSRSNLARTIRVGGYNRLVAANDWGRPLSFGASVSALLWGRDEGYYYRASGLDLTGTRENGGVEWRLFAEQQRGARAENDFSLAKLSKGRFAPNIAAQRGNWAGASLRAVRTVGLDPRGWRAFGDVRLEGAGGETNFGRAALDLTFSRALGPTRSNAPLAGITVSGGTTVGDVPMQRNWFLGGTYTVRGQPAGTASGNAYWLGRAEVAQEIRVGRAALFADLGWAGSRDSVSSVGRPVSGVGTGWSFLDGLLRFDVARGIHPSRDWRTYLYLEGRF